MWPKLYVALRASRDTELREELPGHVVDSWIGHNEAVAKKNYLQVTDDHFDRYSKAKQKAKQSTAALSRTTSQTKTATPEKTRELPVNAVQCVTVQNEEVGDGGLSNLRPPACKATWSTRRKHQKTSVFARF